MVLVKNQLSMNVMNRHQHKFEEIEKRVDLSFSRIAVWVVLAGAISLLILAFIIGAVVMLLGG